MKTGQEFLSEMFAVKSVIAATESQGVPSVRVINIFGIGDGAVYFVTPFGKDFCSELETNGNMAIIAQYPSRHVRLNGVAEKLPAEWVERLLAGQPRLSAMYSGERMGLLRAFRVRDAYGESFDLSGPHPSRTEFAIGSAKIPERGYEIDGSCISCGKCLDICPSEAIVETEPEGKTGQGYGIVQESCIRCGGCMAACPANAVMRR